MLKTYKVEMAGQALDLRADRSLWWSAQKILFIADLHAGKAEHFRRAGLALPGGSLEADLNRLSRSIKELQPLRVIVLGDLFHSDINKEWQTVASWIQAQPCSIELVRGNHDRFIDDQTFASGGLTIHKEGTLLGPFSLRHHPAEPTSQYSLCGHLHPVFTFRTSTADRLRMPCFVIQPRQIILPAYGTFTGGYKMSRADGTLIGTAPDFEALIVMAA